MKICTTCHKKKQLKSFNKNKTKSDKLNSTCRLCSHLRSKLYYKENRNYHLIQIKKRRRLQLKKLHDFIIYYLKQHPCIDCGEKNIIVLHFDHKNPKEKGFEIARGVGWGISLDRLKQEIKKCVTRCANCHLKRTAKQFNWYKNKIKLDP